jgi:hypothetical protein
MESASTPHSSSSLQVHFYNPSHILGNSFHGRIYAHCVNSEVDSPTTGGRSIIARSRELHQRPNTLTQTELSFSSSLAIPRRTIHTDISGYRSGHRRQLAISISLWFDGHTGLLPYDRSGSVTPLLQEPIARPGTIDLIIMPLSAGARLGPYEILAATGKGGMGEVYRARDTRLNRDVAVKVLPQAFASASERERFQREGHAASTLSHPNICAVYDVGEALDHLSW